MADLWIGTRVLDYGLEVLDDEATHVYLCTGEPTDFADATTDSPTGKALGNKNFGAGAVFNSPAAGDPAGRAVTSNAVTGGTITVAGTPARWAVTDNTNSRLLAHGAMTDAAAISLGQTWSLDAITIRIPGVMPMLVDFPTGFLWPRPLDYGLLQQQSKSANNQTLNATGTKSGMVGRLFINGGGTHALSAAGGGSIGFRLSTGVFADAGTSVTIGIQGVATTAGPPARPDDTFTVYRTIAGNSGVLTLSNWNTFSLSGGTGSVNLSHNDLIAVVWDMTARGGSDSLTLQVSAASVSSAQCLSYSTGAWATSSVSAGNILITFDDGALGILESCIPTNLFTGSGADLYTDTSNPDERGMAFQVPFGCKIDALGFFGGATDGSSECTIKLYQDPYGAITQLEAINLLAEQMGSPAVNGTGIYPLTSSRSLAKNTDYAVTVRATGSTNTRLASLTLPNTGCRVFLPGATSLKYVSRQNDTGSFVVEDPAITIKQVFVRVTQIYDGG